MYPVLCVTGSYNMCMRDIARIRGLLSLRPSSWKCQEFVEMELESWRSYAEMQIVDGGGCCEYVR